MDVKTAVVIALLAIVLVVLAVCLIFIVKLRRNFHAAGSYLASYRATTSDGWTEGFCVYGRDTLSWYKLVSLSMHPAKTWTRMGMHTGKPVKRVGEDGTVWVDVAVTADDHRFFLFMSEADYNGLVSWRESAPPHPSHLGTTYSLD